MPGLELAVKEERRRQREQAWAVAGVILFLLLLPLAVAWAMGHDRVHHDHHWWDPDDDWDV